MLGNEDENNWVLFSPKFSTQSRKQVEFEENDGLRPYDCSGTDRWNQPLGLVLALLVQQKKTPIWCLFLLAPNAGLEPATT